jgi:hypothetical protein
MRNVNTLNQNNDYGMNKPKIDVPFSALQMGATNQSTGHCGFLIPGHCHELIPSQKIKLNQSIGIQFSPFVSNLFHEINGEMLYYFVPYRLLWPDFEKFITGGIDGQDNTIHPTMSLKALKDAAGGDLIHTLADYFGMPINHDVTTEDADASKPTAFLWWAYNKIYNDHIRIPDVETTEIDKDNNTVLRGNYDFDYFNRSRVYQQRGVVPSIPVSDELLQLEHTQSSAVHNPNAYVTDSNGATVMFNTASAEAKAHSNTTQAQQNLNAFLDDNTVDIAAHSLDQLGMNMNDFLLGLGIMRMQINNAKVQPRYIEQLQMRWGLYPEDMRLARPEYLGSRYFNVATDTVTQTGFGDTGSGQTPQGNITGQAWGDGSNMSVAYTAKEHGILMSMFIIKPKPVYEGGLAKRWVKNTRFDYPTPELANTPDVPVTRGEIMYTGIKANDDTLFGWQGIYEEYRTLNNIVSGRLRPSANDNLVSYTLARHWEPASPPLLNKEFIQCNPDMDRILQYTDEPDFIYFLRNDIKTAIPLPVQSEPGDLSFI